MISEETENEYKKINIVQGVLRENMEEEYEYENKLN
jgi:hypothetical protein